MQRWGLGFHVAFFGKVQYFCLVLTIQITYFLDPIILILLPNSAVAQCFKHPNDTWQGVREASRTNLDFLRQKLAEILAVMLMQNLCMTESKIATSLKLLNHVA